MRIAYCTQYGRWGRCRYSVLTKSNEKKNGMPITLRLLQAMEKKEKMPKLCATTINEEKKGMPITLRLLQAMEKKEKMPTTLCLSQSMR